MSDGTKLRIWHASRDAYHCAFRFLRLLVARPDQRLELERMRALDLLLLFPPYMHRMTMDMATKAKFRALSVPDFDETFVRLPSAASIFQDLRIYQNSALSHLVALGIFEHSDMKNGVVRLRTAMLPTTLAESISYRNTQAENLVGFLVNGLAHMSLGGPDGLYRRIGLPGKQLPI